jgi:cyclic beta-1,2-glucan synthetase
MDWREFVETMSMVEQTLRGDSGDIYGKMDFTTRDRYRHVVEKIARFSRLSEGEVARLAIRLAHEGAAGKGGEDRTAHVGFYLIDQGSAELDRLAEARSSPSEALRKWGRRFPFLLYGGSILLLTLLFTWMLLMRAHAGGLQHWPLAPIGLLMFFGAGHLAIALVNWLSTLLVMPHPLPRMDFSEGIPTQFRTLAVVPTMLTGARNIAELIEAMEVRFLANRDDNLHFALLTDFRDAPAEALPEDEALLRLARKGIEDLNIKYGDPKVDSFFLFHRPRRWNPQDRIWMGYERKRGKLADLNALLRGEAQGGSGARFSLVVGDTAVLWNVT